MAPPHLRGGPPAARPWKPPRAADATSYDREDRAAADPDRACPRGRIRGRLDPRGATEPATTQLTGGFGDLVIWRSGDCRSQGAFSPAQAGQRARVPVPSCADRTPAAAEPSGTRC